MEDTAMPNIIPQENIQSKILEIRGKKVMLDRDLACLYEVETKALNQGVRRNLLRFPEDFMFQLTEHEWSILRSQIVTSSWGGLRYSPYAFTEQGVAMLSSVLRSPKAIEVNIQIMRAFVRLRIILSENATLRYAIEGLERRMNKNERDIQIAINAIQQLLNPPVPKKPKRRVGFTDCD